MRVVCVGAWCVRVVCVCPGEWCVCEGECSVRVVCV